ncbi:MAG: ASCH domain-containing protein [Alphaproteobacteria bacterium]|nr:MAG: ASCH domain-containing protein [Alphaproteobacteria bacterium]
MLFAKRLRQGIKDGRITCTVRIWRGPRVKAGGVYPMEEGHVLVESIRPIAIEDVTGDLARRSGFLGVVDLLKTARHGSGTNVYLVEFQYIPPG